MYDEPIVNEVIDAGIQKIKLYIHKDNKEIKKLNSKMRKAIKSNDYKLALKYAEEKLLVMNSLYRKAETIDDDEIYIIMLTDTIKAILISILIGAVLVYLCNGVLTGSGPIVMTLKRFLDARNLLAFKSIEKVTISSIFNNILMPWMTTFGTVGNVKTVISSINYAKWEARRHGDINRETNAGRPDSTRVSMSRTDAKNKYMNMIKMQKQEIAMLKNNIERNNHIHENINYLIECVINESKLTTKERNNLDSSEFGLPDERKFPLNDKRHVEMAIKMFKYCNPDKREILAKNIAKAARRYNITLESELINRYISE